MKRAGETRHIKETEGIDTATNLPYQRDHSGTLGDIYSAYDTTTGGYAITLLDSAYYPSGYTWLAPFYNEQVTWSLDNIIFNEDTIFRVSLSAGGYWPEPVFTSRDLTIKTNATVPEPSTVGLLISFVFGIAGFGSFRNKK